VLKNLDLSENSGPYNGLCGGLGAGVEFQNCSGIIEDCTIRHSKAIFQEGREYFGFGAGAFLVHLNVTMNDTLVEGNEAFGSAGILVAEGSTLEINRGEISRNIARNTYLKGKTINGNRTGIEIWRSSKVSLNSVTFEGNRVDNLSGAVDNFGLLTLTGSNKFMDNTAKTGAAIYNRERGQMKIKGIPSFINNTATDKGGVIYNVGDITIWKAIFSYNEAGYGSAIYNEGDITDMGSMLWKTTLNMAHSTPTALRAIWSWMGPFS
jgi:predicted outer membrane repeat protein